MSPFPEIKWTKPIPLELSPADVKAEDGDVPPKDVNYKLETTTNCKYV